MSIMSSLLLLNCNLSNSNTEDILSASSYSTELESIKGYIVPFIDRINPLTSEIYRKNYESKVKILKNFGFSPEITKREEKNIYKAIKKHDDILCDKLTILCCRDQKFDFAWVESQDEIFYLFKEKNNKEWYLWSRMYVSYDEF